MSTSANDASRRIDELAKCYSDVKQCLKGAGEDLQTFRRFLSDEAGGALPTQYRQSFVLLSTAIAQATTQLDNHAGEEATTELKRIFNNGIKAEARDSQLPNDQNQGVMGMNELKSKLSKQVKQNRTFRAILPAIERLMEVLQDTADAHGKKDDPRLSDRKETKKLYKQSLRVAKHVRKGLGVVRDAMAANGALRLSDHRARRAAEAAAFERTRHEGRELDELAGMETKVKREDEL